MNDNQMNKHRMMRKVTGVFIQHEHITKKYLGVARSYAVFAITFGSIEKTVSKSNEGTAGTLESKLELKAVMARNAEELASAAFASAKDSGDSELAAVMDINYSDIRYDDDQSALGLSNSVYDQLKEILPSLEDYMVSADDLARLKKDMDAYRIALQSTGGVDSAVNTKKLAGLFKKAMDQLNDHLDRMVKRIRSKEPLFFDTYTKARNIIDLGGRRRSDDDDMM